MDAISFSYADKQAKRIKKFIENPDSDSGIVTVPKVIGAGENVTVPAGRVAVLPNVQVDGALNVEAGGEIFIPAGANFGDLEAQIDTKVNKVTLTDNAIVRANGTTGALQNSGVIIDDGNNIIGANSIFLGGSTSANQLDDYEEGTWTPIITPESGTITSYTIDIANYTKIGDIVKIYCRFTINNIGTASGYYMRCAGHPFSLLSNGGDTATGRISNTGVLLFHQGMDYIQRYDNSAAGLFANAYKYSISGVFKI